MPARTVFTKVRTVSLISTALDNLAQSRLSRVAKSNHAVRGQRMAVFANEWVGTNVNLYGYYERRTLDALFDFLAPLLPEFRDGVALDIGANIGNHSVYFDKYFATVHAFEPNPSTFQLLRYNAAYSAHVVPHNLGLGSEAGDLTLFEDLSNVGAASLLPDEGLPDGTAVSVRIARLDELTISLDGLCFVKIDVEGFEPRVIDGGAGVIAKHAPLIVFEQHAGVFGPPGTETEAIGRLRALGYAIGWMSFPLDARPWPVRKLVNVVEVFRGKKLRAEILFGDRVPAIDHAMLIGVPPRFQKALDVDK